MRIIATIGPNSANEEIIRQAIYNGADTLRLNFSHFYEEQFKFVIEEARNIKSDISIMADLCGKKIRVSKKINKVFKVNKGENILFCSEDIYESICMNIYEKIIPLTLKSDIIKNNDIKYISMKDGTIKFEIVDKDKVFLKAKAINDGIIRGGKGCNISGINNGEVILSKRDKECLKWALNKDINIIAQSFVENDKEILEIRKFIKNSNYDNDKVKIFSKIETTTGLENYKNILNVSDGIVIARGDLIPECGLINSVIGEMKLLNSLKKEELKKEIIVATHLLDSMMKKDTPNITEVESICNFIKYGVNGFLLASETSVGKRPIESIVFIQKIIKSFSKLE